MGGHAADMHVPGRYFHYEQHVQASEEDRVGMEEIAGQQSVRLNAEERPPGAVVAAGRWPVCGAKDPPDGRRAELVAGRPSVPARG
jgi:hypothetical protein